MNHKTIERGGKPFVLVPKEAYERMCAALEDRDDARAYDHAKAKNQELVPGIIADRLLAGENPVRVWREHRHRTQDQLAVAAAITKPYLSQIETGKRSASVEVLRNLARALGVDLDDVAPEPSHAVIQQPRTSQSMKRRRHRSVGRQRAPKRSIR